MSNALLPIANKISRVYLIVALVIILLYGIIFKLAILATENQSSERLLAITAPHHFKLYQLGKQGTVKIDPLLTIYDEFDLLPHQVKRRLSADQQGLWSFQFQDETELAVLSKKIASPNDIKMVWAVLNIDATEWNDNSFLLIELLIALLGLLIFIIAGFTIKKIANQLAEPFVKCANQLNCPEQDDFSPINIQGELSLELANTLNAINAYRARIEQALNREKSITRYISHEIRTPMTVIKGCTNILERQHGKTHNKQLNRIDNALIEMEKLTNVFLLLARKQDLKETHVIINKAFLQKAVTEQNHQINANNNTVSISIDTEISLAVEPLLFETAYKNLLINAVNCTEDGSISIVIDQHSLTVSDNGIGLQEQARSYEGFGVGLLLVNDICQRYHWQFELTENSPTPGCTATIFF